MHSVSALNNYSPKEIRPLAASANSASVRQLPASSPTQQSGYSLENQGTLISSPSLKQISEESAPPPRPPKRTKESAPPPLLPARVKESAPPPLPPARVKESAPPPLPPARVKELAPPQLPPARAKESAPSKITSSPSSFDLPLQKYTSGELVYRRDHRPPEQIRLEGGFKSRGNNEDVVLHVSGISFATLDSAYVPLTNDLDWTIDLAKDEVNANLVSKAYVYCIDSDGFYSARDSLDQYKNLSQAENENYLSAMTNLDVMGGENYDEVLALKEVSAAKIRSYILVDKDNVYEELSFFNENRAKEGQIKRSDGFSTPASEAQGLTQTLQENVSGSNKTSNFVRSWDSSKFTDPARVSPELGMAADPQPKISSTVATAPPIGSRLVNMGASAQASLQGGYQQSAINRQFNAMEQLKDISCRYNAADNPSDRRQIAATLLDREFISDMSAILINQINDPYSDVPRDMEVDKVKLKACKGYVDLVHSLIDSGDLNAREVFNRLMQPAPDLNTPTPFLFSLASVAGGNTEEQCRLASAMGSLLDTVTQQTGADLRPRMRMLLLNSQYDKDTHSKYTDFYTRLTGDGRFKGVTGGVVATYKLGRSGLMPTNDEVKAAGGSKTRIGKIEAAQQNANTLVRSENRQGGGSLGKFISENKSLAKPASIAGAIDGYLNPQYLEKIESKEKDIFKEAKHNLDIKLETPRYQKEQEKIQRQMWDEIINDTIKDELDWEIKSKIKDTMWEMAEKKIKESVKKIMSDPNTDKLIGDKVRGTQSTPPLTGIPESQVRVSKNHAAQIKDEVVNDVNRTREEQAQKIRQKLESENTVTRLQEQAEQERVDATERARREAEDNAKQVKSVAEEAEREAKESAEQVRRAAEEEVRNSAEQARRDAEERGRIAKEQVSNRTQQGQTAGRGYAGPSVLPGQDGYFR